MAEAKVKKTEYLGTGRRKTSVARIRLSEGSGKIDINGRGLEDYFTEDKDRAAVTGPLHLTEMRNRLDMRVRVEGGGFTGQAGAICQGLARALIHMFSPAAAKPAADGAATDDGRMKERKKYGRKCARRSFQFSKR
jgi:small subunit ribosomal protein S9